MTGQRLQKLLIIGPVPPPFAGPEIGTKTLLDSTVLNERYEVLHINTTVRKSNSEKGKLDAWMVYAFIRYFFSLTRMLASERPDFALYCPTTATLKGWMRDGTTIILCKLFSTKLFMQFRGGHFRLFYCSQPSIVQRCLRGLLGRIQMMLAQSERLERQFEGTLPERQIGRFPNSISSEYFDAFEGTRARESSAPVTILFVGHLVYAKGYCDLLETVPQLCAKYDVRFRFVGARSSGARNIQFNQVTGEPLNRNDPDDWFEHYAERPGFTDRLEFLGAEVSGEEKVRVFEEADIFVLPSYSEGFSMAVLEAMAAGLAIVVTPVGAAPDIINNGHNGFLVEPGDIESLVSHLELLIRDPGLRRSVGVAAREECGKNFKVEQVSRQLIEILEGRYRRPDTRVDQAGAPPNLGG